MNILHALSLYFWIISISYISFCSEKSHTSPAIFRDISSNSDISFSSAQDGDQRRISLDTDTQSVYYVQHNSSQTEPIENNLEDAICQWIDQHYTQEKFPQIISEPISGHYKGINYRLCLLNLENDTLNKSKQNSSQVESCKSGAAGCGYILTSNSSPGFDFNLSDDEEIMFKPDKTKQDNKNFIQTYCTTKNIMMVSFATLTLCNLYSYMHKK